MIYTAAQQKLHRKAFIEECRQKAWAAACHADWISKSIDGLLAHYQKLQAEDGTLQADIKQAETAIDYHTVENRQKRRDMQARRDQIAKDMKVVVENAQHGQTAMTGLLQSVESALELAKHAEGWSWKEPEEKPAAANAQAHDAQE